MTPQHLGAQSSSEKMYKRNSRYHISDENWKVVSKYLATSSVRKDRYLKDLKPFKYVFSLSNIGLQGLKAGMTVWSLLMMDYSKYEQEQNAHPEKNLPDFDWSGAIEKRLPMLRDYSIRFYSVSVIKKCLEEVALAKLSVRLVDKLTKDAFLSLKRKVVKFGHSVACQKIFFSFLHANVLLNGANFVYDLVYATITHIQSAINGKRSAIEPVKAVGYFANRVAYYSIVAVSGAAGYAGGSFLNETYGGVVGQMIFEVLALGLFGGVLPN